MQNNLKDFTVLILTNGRPDNVKTIESLRRCGYTGPIYLCVDNLDKTKDQYIKKYGDNVCIFDKREIGKTFDKADNFDELRTITYARNASFNIAEKLGYKYFIQLDDDYVGFDYRFDNNFKYIHETIKNKSLDKIFSCLLEFYKSINAHSIALSQGGDFIGGEKSGICFGKGVVGLKRKCMNSFICSTERKFSFLGTMNEDVNTYTTLANRGALFFTVNQVCLEQTPTQSNAGGITEMYKKWGTYVKSFYTVMHLPSSVTIKEMGFTTKRLHHSINWKTTVPMIVRESVKKK